MNRYDEIDDDMARDAEPMDSRTPWGWLMAALVGLVLLGVMAAGGCAMHWDHDNDPLTPDVEKPASIWIPEAAAAVAPAFGPWGVALSGIATAVAGVLAALERKNAAKAKQAEQEAAQAAQTAAAIVNAIDKGKSAPDATLVDLTAVSRAMPQEVKDAVKALRDPPPAK